MAFNWDWLSDLMVAEEVGALKEESRRNQYMKDLFLPLWDIVCQVTRSEWNATILPQIEPRARAILQNWGPKWVPYWYGNKGADPSGKATPAVFAWMRYQADCPPLPQDSATPIDPMKPEAWAATSTAEPGPIAPAVPPSSPPAPGDAGPMATGGGAGVPATLALPIWVRPTLYGVGVAAGVFLVGLVVWKLSKK